jgi:enoyl-CoA hydratase/carnithine racemase
VSTREDVRLEVADGVGVVTIARPHARNAIALATIRELDEALAEVAAADVSAVVLTGEGDRAFVSGGDLKDFGRLRALSEAEEMAASMRRVLDRVATLPVPVVAALNGHALGGGAEVAVAADVRIAAADVRIGFNQSTLGIMPAWGGVERLTELVGRSRALLLLTSGRTVDAVRAERIGLVDEVVERAGFEEGWRSLAAAVASTPPQVVRAIKRLVAEVRPAVHPATAAEAVSAFAELWVAPDHWRLAEEADARRRVRGVAGAT